MADLLADFMEDIMDIVDGTPEVTANPAIANLAISPINVEDWVPLSSPTCMETETPNK